MIFVTVVEGRPSGCDIARRTRHNNRTASEKEIWHVYARRHGVLSCVFDIRSVSDVALYIGLRSFLCGRPKSHPYNKVVFRR